MRKTMIVMLLIIFSVCCVSIANAADTDDVCLEKSYQLFGKYGNYSSWDVNTKVNWLNILKPVSSEVDVQHIDGLIASKKETLIDAYFAKRFGAEGHPETISIYYFLQERWGDEFLWSFEQRAQQTVWIETYMPNEMWDTYHYVIPPANIISPEKAKEIASAELLNAGFISPDADMEIAVRYGIHRKQLAEMPCHYVVDFRELRIIDEVERMIPVFSCYITNEGEVMDSSYNRNILYSEITPSEFPQLPYQAFSEWTLEEKAEFSDAFYLQMVDHMSSRPNYRGVYYYATLHRYGLPGCDDLSQEQAVQIARKAATTVGANQDYLSRANARVYFDVTDEDKHQWKIYLSTLFSYNTRFGDSIGYFVVLDAATGDVLNIYEHTANSPKELFY